MPLRVIMLFLKGTNALSRSGIPDFDCLISAGGDHDFSLRVEFGLDDFLFMTAEAVDELAIESI